MVKDITMNGASSMAVSEAIVDSVRSSQTSVEDVITQELASKCDLSGGSSISSHSACGSCECVWPVPSLISGNLISEDVDLKVPIVTAPYLDFRLEDEYENSAGDNNIWTNEIRHALQGSAVFLATLIERRKLTKAGALKDKYEIMVKLENNDVKYEPGDAFYFVVPNVPEEVEWLLKRLKLNEPATKQCKVTILENCTRKNVKIPMYLASPRSLLDIFTNCVDIRRAVSKSCLRYLADACTDSSEKRRLLELVSMQGVSEYERYVQNPSSSILDILHAFPSCAPSLSRLLEYLAQLQPRPYSVASYNGSSELRFIYSLVSIPAENGRFFTREGLATGWFTRCQMGTKIGMFLKKPTNFRLLSQHAKCPLIMVGPGTGIAPFIGFIERIREEKEENIGSFTNNWLFFGCKNEKQDFLFRETLDNAHRTGILNQFHVAFSRDDESGSLGYVQDCIRRHGRQISDLILGDPSVRIYVCGDGKRMAPDVFKTFCDALTMHGGKTETEAVEICRMIQTEGRYVQDVWG